MTFLRKYSIAVIILVTAVIFVAAGTVRGEADTVYRKAVNICMECIGLG
ncbi:thioredoxin [Lachnospiraceae bacterium NSJ-143]|nr:thioredoxin [Lachnospiraceae bacterium NSJ-143]